MKRGNEEIYKSMVQYMDLYSIKCPFVFSLKSKIIGSQFHLVACWAKDQEGVRVMFSFPTTSKCKKVETNLIINSS